MSAEDGADLARVSLTSGEQVGSGGQGEVLAIDDGALLYKKYKDPSKVNGDARQRRE